MTREQAIEAYAFWWADAEETDDYSLDKCLDHMRAARFTAADRAAVFDRANEIEMTRSRSRKN